MLTLVLEFPPLAVDPRPSPEDDAPLPHTPSTQPGPEFPDGARWVGLVDRVRCGDETGMEELYRLFSRGIRFFLCRQLGPEELDDKVHDTFLIVVQAIQRGDLREPERLMGFVRTVVRRQVAAHIDKAVHSRREQLDLDSGLRVADTSHDPEQEAMVTQRNELMAEVLRSISRRDREILTRFYLYEEAQETICREMNLSETQFRLLKSRAKARFGELGRRRLSRKQIARAAVSRPASAGRS